MPEQFPAGATEVNDDGQGSEMSAAVGVEIFILNKIAHLKDEQGRPLTESAAPPELKAGVPMEYRECFYPGTRYKHSKHMNVSALRQIQESWPEILAWFRIIRRHCLRDSPESEPNLLDLMRIGAVACAVPSYVTLRAQSPVAIGSLPASLAGLYKAARGFFHMIYRMIVKGLGEQTVMNPQQLFEYMERTKQLLSRTEVCAGPNALIMQMLEAIHYGGEVTPALESKVKASVQDVDKKSILFFEILRQLSAATKEIGGMPSAHLRSWIEDALAATDELVEDAEAKTICGLPPAHQALIIGHTIRHIAALSPRQRKLLGARLSPGERNDAPKRLQKNIESTAIFIRRCAGRDESLNTDDFNMLVGQLLQYLEIEKVFLLLFTDLKAQLNLSLGRNAHARSLTHADITQNYGPTLRELFTELFGLRFENSLHRTLIEHGAQSLEIEFDAH